MPAFPTVMLSDTRLTLQFLSQRGPALQKTLMPMEQKDLKLVLALLLWLAGHCLQQQSLHPHFLS